MTGEITMTAQGNLTADPDLKHLNDGSLVANFSIANSTRRYNSTSKQYENGPTTYINCKAFGNLADHLGKTLHKGDRVIVVGTFAQRSYTNNKGEKRTVFELTATDIGPSLQWATGTMTRANNNSNSGYSNNTNNGYGQQSSGADPWGI